MVTGMSNGGLALGATLGPIVGGALVDVVGYPWMVTGLTILGWLMVSIRVSKPLLF